MLMKQFLHLCSILPLPMLEPERISEITQCTDENEVQGHQLTCPQLHTL